MTDFSFNPKLYLQVLPMDLLPSLLLNFSSEELLVMLQLRYTRCFDMIFKSQVFWNAVWKRDISTIIDAPVDIYTACMKYQEIHEFLISDHGSDKIHYLATHGYDVLLCKRLIDLGSYNWAMMWAASGGQIKIVDKMLELGANNYNDTLSAAISKGHLEIAELMVALGANNHTSALASAAYNGHLPIVELMLKLGANNYNDALWHSTLNNHTEISELIRKYQNRMM